MVLDSCYSGAVVGRAFRPAPLGDASFGQLSYDKRLRILAAAQPAQTEYGDWLADAGGRTLLADALERSAVTHSAGDLGEWLQVSARSVPLTMKTRYPETPDAELVTPVLLDFGRRPAVGEREPRASSAARH